MANREDLTKEWPHAPRGARERLRYTLDAYEGFRDDTKMVTATTALSAGSGEMEWVGLALGDLRTLDDLLGDRAIHSKSATEVGGERGGRFGV